MNLKAQLRGVIGVIALSGGLPSAYAAPGDHVRAGEWVITPSVATGFEYHSNIYLADGYDNPVVGAPSWEFDPRIEAALDQPDNHVELGAGYHLKKFIDFKPGDFANVQNLDRFTDADASLGLDLLKRGLVGVRVDDRFSVQNWPSELATSDVSANIVVTSNDLTGGLVVRPGSALEIVPSGMLGVDNYNVPFDLLEAYQDNPNLNNRFSYGPALKASWRFLPRTSLLVQGSVTWNRWNDNLVAAVGPDSDLGVYGEYIGKPDSLFWRASGGLRGQLTTKVSAELSAGFGQGFYDEETVVADSGLPGSSAEVDTTGADLNEETFARDLKSFEEGLLLNAQVAWKPEKGQMLVLGYRKDFQDAFFTNYVAYNYAFVRYEGTLWEQMTANAEAAVRLDAFHGEISRKDVDVKLSVAAAWKFNEWLSATGGLGWNQRACGDANCADDTFYSSQYDDFFGTLGVKLTY